MMDSRILLQIRELSCERDDRVLINKLSLEIGVGDLVQLEGPNGSGKTTLLRVLCGLSTRYAGEVSWRGESLARCRHSYQSEMLYIGHGAAIKSVLTPLENLRWLVRLHSGGVDDGVLISALAKVGLRDFEHTPCFMLSAGQQRRVGLARLFASRALLWILDEPFTAIDRHGVAEIERWLEEHVEAGGAVLLTTHHPLNLSRPPRRIVLGDAA